MKAGEAQPELKQTSQASSNSAKDLAMHKQKGVRELFSMTAGICGVWFIFEPNKIHCVHTDHFYNIVINMFLLFWFLFIQK